MFMNIANIPPLCFNSSINFLVKCFGFSFNDLNCKVYNNSNFYMMDSGKCIYSNNITGYLHHKNINNNGFMNNNVIWDGDELFYDFMYDFINFFNYKNIFILFFVSSSSILFSLLFVSNLYKNMVNQFVEKYNNNKDLYEYDPYFFEYLDEYNDLESIELDKNFFNSLKSKYIKQNTPKGEIIMNYNNNNNSFDYYCKKSNSIPFLYLDVVSRIFVVKYNCKKLYIDNYDNIDSINDFNNCTSDNNKISENDETKHSQNNSQNIFYKSNKFFSNKSKIEYVSNKYKYKGTIEDFYKYCKNNNYKVNNQYIDKNEYYDNSNSEIDNNLDDNNLDYNKSFFLEKLESQKNFLGDDIEFTKVDVSNLDVFNIQINTNNEDTDIDAVSLNYSESSIGDKLDINHDKAYSNSDTNSNNDISNLKKKNSISFKTFKKMIVNNKNK